MSKDLEIIHGRNVLLLKILTVCAVIDFIINLIVDPSILKVILPPVIIIIGFLSLLVYNEKWIEQTMYITVLLVYLPFVFLVEAEPILVNYIFFWIAFVLSSLYQRVLPVVFSAIIVNILTVFYFFQYKQIIFKNLYNTDVVYIIFFNLFLAIFLYYSGRYSESQLIFEKKQTEDVLKRTEMLTVVGQLAAGVAHEIKNPVTVLAGFVQLLRQSDDDVNRQKYYDIMQSELKRIHLITNEFLVLGKQTNYEYKKKKIPLLIKEVVLLLKSEAEKNKVNIVVEITPELPSICCEPNQLKQVFINVIKNGIESMPDGGNLKITVTMDDNKGIKVEMVDEGCGISNEIITLIGTPFFTTKKEGTGLGMMVSYRIIENHKGKLEIESQPNVGTKVYIHLPIDTHTTDLA